MHFYWNDFIIKVELEQHTADKYLFSSFNFTLYGNIPTNYLHNHKFTTLSSNFTNFTKNAEQKNATWVGKNYLWLQENKKNSERDGSLCHQEEKKYNKTDKSMLYIEITQSTTAKSLKMYFILYFFFFLFSFRFTAVAQ